MAHLGLSARCPVSSVEEGKADALSFELLQLTNGGLATDCTD
jgi:hypothetical protein